MPNTDHPFGAVLVGRLGGGSPECRRTSKDASASRIYKGDFVKLSSDGKIDPAAAGDRILGVSLQDTTASTAEDVYICDDPRALYSLQDDGIDRTLALTDVGLNFDIIATTGNATTGRSRHQIDASSLQTTSRQLRVIGIDPIVGNAAGQYAKWLCIINEHEYQIGGTGV